MRKILIVLFAVVAGMGISYGINVAFEGESEPRQAPSKVVIVQQSPIIPIPSTTPSAQSVPEAPSILGAINLMKPNSSYDASRAERQLHAQLVDQGYTYWVIHSSGIERINYNFMEGDKARAVEFAIYPDGVTMDASRYGRSTAKWGVTCASHINGSTVIDDMSALKNRVDRAAAKLYADPECEYLKF